jgi:conserved hypothetical protein
MTRFSERYGYVKPSKVLIRDGMPLSIQNAICTCFDELQNFLKSQMGDNARGFMEYRKLEEYLWVYFFNRRKVNFNIHSSVATDFLEDDNALWFNKLDLVEVAIKYLFNRESQLEEYYRVKGSVAEAFTTILNSHFERLNFAYRVVDKEIVEITSKEEIAAIEDALQDSTANIRMHLSKALELYAKRPEGDYSNSIKESISAVEAYCREKTNENTLGRALNHLETKGISLPKVLKEAFEKLYAYTNQGSTGIRHALMDQDGTYVSSRAEALFMLVSCSAFINYLSKKI